LINVFHSEQSDIDPGL